MTDVFNADGTPATPAPTATGALADLVGDGKKFKTVEDLARGKIEADTFIERLKEENAQALAEARKAALADEQLESLRNEIKALREARGEPSRDNTNPALTLESVKTLVAQTLTQAESNRTAQQNVNVANDAMVKTYGSLEAAGAAVKAKAVEVGMSMDALRDLAAKSPSAFIKIMGGEASKQSAEPLNPNRVVTGIVPNSSNEPAEGTKEYFDTIQKRSRSEYFTPRVQQAIWKAIQAGTYKL